MNKNLKKALTLGCAMLIGTGALSINAANLTKKVEAVYNNIKVTYDGKNQAPQYEPFLINGTVYVSLRDAGQITNNNVNWDSTNKTVQITSKAPQSSVTEQELANKNLQIATLQNQVTNLEKKLAYYEKQEEDKKEEDNKKPSLDSKGMEKLLATIEDEYDEKLGIYWDFSLNYNSKNEYIELVVEFDGKEDKTAFNKIADSSKLTNFLRDICDTIQSELGTKIEVRGELFDNRYDDTIGTFTCNTRGRFTYNKQLTEKDLKAAASDLSVTKLPTFEYASLKDKVISVDDIVVEDESGDYETISFKLYTSLDTSDREIWNEFVNKGNRTDMGELETLMEDIIDDLEDSLGDREFSGYIYNNVGKGKLIGKYEDSDLTLYKY